nr:hypothetical protein B0A51_00910 [Rachicladosporium sp. CCFEE 5018]
MQLRNSVIGCRRGGDGRLARARRRRWDVWEVLREKRRGKLGLHDAVQAPPEIKVRPRERFKVEEGARVVVSNVPKGAEILSKREELGVARREVIERYREMMGRGKG